MSHGHGVYVLQVGAAVGQRLLHRRHNVLDMLAGCHLGHHAAVDRMKRRLGGDDVGPEAAAVLDDAHRRFIARGFYAQYFHVRWTNDPLTHRPLWVNVVPYGAAPPRPLFVWAPSYGDVPWASTLHSSEPMLSSWHRGHPIVSSSANRMMPPSTGPHFPRIVDPLLLFAEPTVSIPSDSTDSDFTACAGQRADEWTACAGTPIFEIIVQEEPGLASGGLV